MIGFERRLLFLGQLTFTTAMHIGGGRSSLAVTDRPVLRGPDELPYVPGSSLKGSFRSTVEKLAATAGLKSCGLIEDADCPGAPGEASKTFQKERDKQRWDETTLLNELTERLCDTCKLFGSSLHASKVLFDDLPFVTGPGTTQVRDGVAIDRDSERAKDRLKYDFEVVPPGSVFGFRATLEEPSPQDLGLMCIGLSELAGGFAGVGGIRSRGLGRCKLEEIRILQLDLRDKSQRAQRLKQYLLGHTPEQKMTPVENVDAFFAEHIGLLFNE